MYVIIADSCDPGELRNDDGGPVYRITLHSRERFIRAMEWKDRYLCLYPYLTGDLQENAGIGAGHVGYTADLPLAPQQAIVIKLWHSVQMNGVDCDNPALAKSR